MKTLNTLANLVFFAALILKFFHIHYNAIFMLVGLAGVLISLLISLLKKENKTSQLVNLTNFAWLILIFVSAKFIPMHPAMVLIPLLLTLLTSFVLVRNNSIKRLSLIAASMIIGLYFFFLPTHKRYDLLSIRWNYEIDTDYITWDKYSWFLYQNGEYDKAMEASEKAKAIAIRLEDEDWIKLIERHKKSIEERNWSTFR